MAAAKQHHRSRPESEGERETQIDALRGIRRRGSSMNDTETHRTAQIGRLLVDGYV